MDRARRLRKFVARCLIRTLRGSTQDIYLSLGQGNRPLQQTTLCFATCKCHFGERTGQRVAQVCEQLGREWQAARKQIATWWRPGLIPFMLGGDHTSTVPVIEALAPSFPELRILQLDAHPDTREEFLEYTNAFWTFNGAHARSEDVIVTAVYDGDTLAVRRGSSQITIRLIGVDSPETARPETPVQFFGPEATDFSRKSLEGKQITLEFEAPDRQGGGVDRYGRTLAYVIMEGGRNFNLELIRLGYGRTYTRYPFKYRKEFLAAEQAAIAQLPVHQEKAELWRRLNDLELFVPRKERGRVTLGAPVHDPSGNGFRSWCKFKVESNPGVDERGGAVERNRGRFAGSEIRPIELAVIQDLISAIQDLPRDNQRVEKLGARVRHIGAPREGARAGVLKDANLLKLERTRHGVRCDPARRRGRGRHGYMDPLNGLSHEFSFLQGPGDSISRPAACWQKKRGDILSPPIAL